MHKVAIIQNDSEMMRYSWADIRPMVHQLGYSYDGYAANDLHELYSRLGKYDAIIIATNACNDNKVRDSLNEHKEIIYDYLLKGKGLAVLFQMKKDENEFFEYLPEELQIKTIKRSEDLKSGDISINESNLDHPLICFPNEIHAQDVKQHCLTNNHVNGLYWTYLQAVNPDKYNIVIEDDSFGMGNRPLILSSRQDFVFRVVASSIALDWQVHEQLWENTIKYVVEGKTHVALITKENSTNYDYAYLRCWLKVNKIPTKSYNVDEVDLEKIQFNIHSVYLLDPSLKKREIANIISHSASFIDEGKAEMIFFDTKSFAKPCISTISNIRQFNTIAKNAITWIKEQFPNNHGYFARSFWNTVDVLTTLTAFSESTDQFRDKILDEIGKHDRGGCYDEVLGATCAMFEVYFFYLGEHHTKTLTSLQWILENYKGKVLFERASAIEILTKFNYEIDENELIRFKQEVMAFFAANKLTISDNEFKLYRYCQTLFTCKYYKEATEICLKFKDSQDQDGKWVNISHTAAVIELLLHIQQKEMNPDIDEMIFKGVEYLYDNYNSLQFSWNNDVLSTAKSLKTLKIFEEIVKLPVDVVKNRIVEENKRINNFSAIESASRLNMTYLDEINRLRIELTEKEHTSGAVVLRLKKLKKVTSIYMVSTYLLFLFLVLVVYLIIDNSVVHVASEYLIQYVKKNSGVLIFPIIVLGLWVTVLIMNAFELIPPSTPLWIKKLIARIVPGPGFSIPEEK